MKNLSGVDVIDCVLCGFKKFSVGVNEERNLVISYNSDSNCSTLYLYDLSIKDMRNLSEMFSSLARNAENDKKNT